MTLLLLAACHDGTLTAKVPKPPTVSFSQPSEGATFAYGEPVRVEVTAADEDSDVTTLALAWTGLPGDVTAPAHPDVDGLAELVLSGLAAGPWALSVAVSDGDGGTGADTLTFTVGSGDLDGDGHVDAALGGDDCDDADPTVSPSAPELCGGGDEDCDGERDEDGAAGCTSVFRDGDGDGWGAGEALCVCDTLGYTLTDGDCDDADPAVFPGALEAPGDGVDADCDGADIVPFLDEDFEAGTDGAAVAGTGCWTCFSGACDETFSADIAYGGNLSLETSGGNNAQLFCTASGFGADFGFEAWLYDDLAAGDELRIVFQESRSTGAEPAVLLGFDVAGCGEWCAQRYEPGPGVTDTVRLGARTAGWHLVEAAATYTSATSVDWELCVDGVCDTLGTEGFAVGTFRLHHDGFHAYIDDVTAWSR